MFELRILSGMHRGATLPLDQRALSIGADDDADVVLVDPGIVAAHATLTPGAQGWTLDALDGEVLGSEDNRPRQSVALAPGQFARLGHVWLCVAGADAPWQSAPPEPPPGAADEDEAEDDAEDEDIEPEVLDDAHEPYSDSPLDDAGPAPEPAPEPPPPPAPPAPPAPPPRAAAKPVRRAGWRRSKMVLMPLALVTILSACAYTMSARKTEDKAPARTPAPAAAPQAPKISQAELRELFQGRLKEVDLLKRFKLDLKDNDWSMQAFLDDEEAARFDRILKAFVHTHNIKFPVHAKVGSAEAMLPFRIREVVTGSNASLVTQDGKRLYVGDELRGLRLVAIDGHQLQFDGERRIKVSW